MKKICILTTILLFSISVFSQINLSIHLKRSYDNDDSIDFIVDTLTIFKDDILFKKIPYPDSLALQEEFQNGKYKFCFKNLFGEKLEEIVSIDEKKNMVGRQNVYLYIDQLQNPKNDKLFIENMKDGDTLKISLKYSGCYIGISENSMKVFKKKNQLYLLFNNKKRKLRRKDLEAIAKYEKELRSLPESNIVSTLNGYNQISLNGEKIEYYEPSMFWKGYGILEKTLGIK